MTTAGWVWNDASIPDRELLVRRVWRRPDFAIYDTITQVQSVTDAAVQIDDDGISVYGCTTVASQSLDPTHLCDDWSTKCLFAFTADHARIRHTGPPPTGVVRDPLQDGTTVGHAHCLVRAERPRASLSRTERKAIKAWIADHSIVLNNPHELLGAP